MLYLTFDQDFCSDSELADLFQTLTKYDAKAVVFVTNESKLFNDYDNGLITLGIHPNFLPILHKPSVKTRLLSPFIKSKRDYMRNIRKTTHGNSVKEVFDYCMELVPSATIMRTHYLVSSTTILSEAAKHGIKMDISTFMPYESGFSFIKYTPFGFLTMKTYSYEDAYMLAYDPSFDITKLFSMAESSDIILNFHPTRVVNDLLIDYAFHKLVMNYHFNKEIVS